MARERERFFDFIFFLSLSVYSITLFYCVRDLDFAEHMARVARVHQLLAGRDFAVPGRAAAGSARHAVFQAAVQMRNFVYCIEDPHTGSACLVDACWDVDGIFQPQGGVMKENIEAAFTPTTTLIIRAGAHPVRRAGEAPALMVSPRYSPHCHMLRQWLSGRLMRTRLKSSECQEALRLADEDIVWESDSVMLRCWSTPGHTAGSITLICADSETQTPISIITGDTLFIGSSGRFDLPDSNPKDMLDSLARLATLPKETVCYPGHHYAISTRTTIGEESATNAMVVQASRYLDSKSDRQSQPRIEKHNVSSLLPECARLPELLAAARPACLVQKTNTHSYENLPHCCSCCCYDHQYARHSDEGSKLSKM